MATTSRAALRYPALSDTPDVVRDISNLANDVDAIYAMFGQGTFSNRPTSSPGTPGKAGRFYYAADQTKLYYDYGTGWLDITPILTLADNSVTTTKIANDAVTAAKIATGAVGADEIADGSITAAEISASLLPSGGAGANIEALRSLGNALGQAARGDLAVSVFAESNGSSALSGQGAANAWYGYASTALSCAITVSAAGIWEVSWGHVNEGSFNTNRIRNDYIGVSINGNPPSAQLSHKSDRLGGGQAMHARVVLANNDQLSLQGQTATDLLEGGFVSSHRWLKAQRVA